MTDLSEEDKFIEHAGIFFENYGLPQMSGRILGYLMISDPSLKSLTEITNRMSIAKSSASTAVKTLHAMTMITKRGRPGSREDYYEINKEVFKSAFSTKTDAAVKFQKLIQEAYHLNLTNSSSDNERNEALNEMIYFYDFFLEEYPKLFVKWEKHKLKLIAEGKLSNPLENKLIEFQDNLE